VSEDEVSEFRDTAAAETAERALGEQRELLVFELDGVGFAVPARRVDAVVAFKPPSPVPDGSPALAGVIQNAGRIIAVLRHPLGAAGGKGETPSRIIVCFTERGLIGLPATHTHGIAPIALDGRETVETPYGAAVLVDPEKAVRALIGEGTN
jgi:chemotaxis signal transduction protein